MHLMFLGTAAAEGYPDPFCACDNCEASRAEGGPALRMRSSALINDELIIDFGPDLLSAAMRFGLRLTNIPYALQTHPHGDHLADLTLFARNNICQLKDIVVADFVATNATIARMDEITGIAKKGRSFTEEEVQLQHNFRITVVQPWDATQIGPYRIQTVRANHDLPNESMLFAIEDTRDGSRLFYGTDTSSLPAETWPRLAELGWTFDTFILDHTFAYAPRNGGHLNLEQFLEEVAGAREHGLINDETDIYATHLAHHSNPHHSEMVRRAAENGYKVAHDGLIVDTNHTEKEATSGAYLG